MATRVLNGPLKTALPTATLPVVRALLDKVSKQGDIETGVLGVWARPSWSGPTDFEHRSARVQLVPCVSALAVREALQAHRGRSGWLVILTDCDDQDLGTGIRSHLARGRLLRPDPIDAVCDLFSAGRIDRPLAERGRELADGLLAVGADHDLPPARSGVLTLDHALGSVAAAVLDLEVDVDAIDLAEVMSWSLRPGQAVALADLRAHAGDALADALIRWLADQSGRARDIVASLLMSGRVDDIVALGLAARTVLGLAPTAGPRALLRREVDRRIDDADLEAYVVAAEEAARTNLDADGGIARVLTRAERLVDRLEAGDFTERSDLLASGLTQRLERFGGQLSQAVRGERSGAGARPRDAPVPAHALNDAELTWRSVETHALASRRDRVDRARAGLRLARWLALNHVDPTSLREGVLNYVEDGGWVDRAYADAWVGVSTPVLAEALRNVVQRVRERRRVIDRRFASLLATDIQSESPVSDGVVNVEDALREVVLPIARSQPTLLVMADGMSVAAGTEIVDDIVGRYESWVECVPADRRRRGAAIAALPSLTKVSRASFFAGGLTMGTQTAERTAFERVTRSGGIRARLFHRAALDTTGAGSTLSPEISASIDDVAGVELVACVLNTIDNALDRSDPGGTNWTAEAVQHLEPLMERARRAGRTVILISDHGHVIERREGEYVTVPDPSSNRSYGFTEDTQLSDGVVRIRGRRVVMHDQDAVLAVDEDLRFGPLKAGYHGGAAPAEVVIPIYVLTSRDAPGGWTAAPPQDPEWWRRPIVAERPQVSVVAEAPVTPTLFDEQDDQTSTAALSSSVIGSTVYRDQRKRGARVTLTDAQVSTLIDSLATAPDHRLDRESAAAALGVAVVQLPGALSMVQRLLNVEQYPVLHRDADGVTVVLDVSLLRDQFGIR